MDFCIEAAAETLIPQIQAIEQRSFSMPWTEAMLRLQLDPGSHVFLTAKAGETVAGYVGMMFVLDEGYISNVAVAPEYRRQGVADSLLDALEQRARTLQLSMLTLEVRVGNAPAVALYEKHGFRRVGLRKNYYEAPREDALIMTREL